MVADLCESQPPSFSYNPKNIIGRARKRSHRSNVVQKSLEAGEAAITANETNSIAPLFKRKIDPFIALAETFRFEHHAYPQLRREHGVSSESLPGAARDSFTTQDGDQRFQTPLLPSKAENLLDKSNTRIRVQKRLFSDGLDPNSRELAKKMVAWRNGQARLRIDSHCINPSDEFFLKVLDFDSCSSSRVCPSSTPSAQAIRQCPINLIIGPNHPPLNLSWTFPLAASMPPAVLHPAAPSEVK